MISDWIECTLGDVITLKRGYDLPKKQRIPGKFPIVSSSGITGTHNVAKVKAPGVVTGRYGTLGEVYYLPCDFWPLNTSLYVQHFNGNDPKFVSYFLRTLDFGRQNVAGAVPGVNRNFLHKLEVRNPPVKIQRKIASILSAYDDLIENNLRRIKILEEMAQALYREWFVKFRFPGHEKVRMVESSVGEIPEGWEVTSLKHLIRFSNGKSIKPGGAGPYKVFGANGIIGGSDEYRFENAVIIGRVGAYCGALARCLDRFWASDNTIVAQPQDEALGVDTIFYLLESMNLNSHAGGAAQPLLTQTTLNRLEVALPPTTVEREFGDFADPIQTQLASLSKANKVLRRTRDLLLPKLISGELDVSNLDITIPEGAA